MSKKRKCRFTQEEQAIHEEAVRLRKMTDRQLVEEFHRAAEPEIRPERTKTEQGDEEKEKGRSSDVKMLITALADGRCKGIKGATVYKITEFAREMGLI